MANPTNLTKKRRIELGYFETRDIPGRPGEVELRYKCRWGGHCTRSEPHDRFRALCSHESHSKRKRLNGEALDACPGERLD